MFAMPNDWTAGLVGSAQKVATRRPLRSNLPMSVRFCASDMTNLRNVTPALKIVTPWRSMLAAKRPAWGKTGAPSHITVVTRQVSAAENI